jgi:NADH:ubiquinone oxidoreductase subunit E
MNQISGATACACGVKATEAELLARLDEVLAEYKGKPGALIPVLQIAQGIFGFLPEKVLKRIALSLGKSYSEVAGVVGFYSFFSTVPRGKHLIRVCLGTACYVRGGKLLLETLKKELEVEVGGTTPDGLFSLEIARCFGACGLAPTLMIDEEVHQRVKPLKVRAILEGYRHGSAGGNGNGNGSGHRASAAKPKPKPGKKKAGTSKASAHTRVAAKKAGSRKSAAGHAKRKGVAAR